MAVCYFILFVLCILILASHSLRTLEKVGGCFLLLILAISIYLSAIFIEENGTVRALRYVGYRECTESELYVMPDIEKDKLLKTYDFAEGTIYWKIDKQDTK